MNGFKLPLEKSTPVLVQGIAGKQGSLHTKSMLEYGTNIVAGVDPGHGGQEIAGVPVFNSVSEALKERGPVAWSVVFVPAPFAKSACLESLAAGLHLSLITEGVPLHDSLAIVQEAEVRGRRVFGPNSPGLAVPGETLLGVIPTEVLSTGTAGVVSRAGTLTYEILQQLTRAGLGQRVVVGLGSERVPGTSFEPVLEWFERDSLVQEIVLVGGVGGEPEGQLADYIKARVSKPVVAYLPGRHSPGSPVSKAIEELENADVSVARSPWELPRLLKQGETL